MMKTTFFLLIACLFPVAANAQEHPQRVLIIRHAEKPPAEDTSVHLNTLGQERADALPLLFKESKSRPEPFPTPDFIFATKDSKHSHRPVETVTPLAKKLKLTIDSTYADEEYSKLASELFKNRKYAGKTILICWHHGMAPELATKLKAEGVPKHWPATAFDRVWEIDYDKTGKATFRDLPQQLLSKDSEK